MKLFILILTLIFGQNTTFAQNQGNISEATKSLFIQAMFNLEDKETVLKLQTELKNHPNVKVVRLDVVSKQVFILTQNLESLSIEEFKSWFGEFGEKLSCVNIGVNGVDVPARFPFTNCKN